MGKKRNKGDNERLTRAKNSGKTNISRPNQKVECGKAKKSVAIQVQMKDNPCKRTDSWK